MEMLQRPYPPGLQNSHLIPAGDASSSSKCRRRSSESRKEAERKRRHRINSHLSTLRSLLPNSTKAGGKAMLLEEVVRHVRQMTTKHADVSCLIAGETDVPTLTCYWEESGLDPDKLIRVTLCCEDRPGLNRDLGRAIGLVPVDAVRAEVVTVGRLTRISLVLRWRGTVDGGEDEGVRLLKLTLQDVVGNRVPGSGVDPLGHQSKRAPVLGHKNCANM